MALHTNMCALILCVCVLLLKLCNVSLALQHCTFHCYPHPQFEPFIHEPASPHVHHILFYECSADVELSHLTDEKLKGGPCYTDPAVFSLTSCLIKGSIVAGWAVGGEVSVLRSLHEEGFMVDLRSTICYTSVLVEPWQSCMYNVKLWLPPWHM